MSTNNSTLIYIPDISGYTSFVKKTEIDHSKHILSELLEIIINSDQLGLTVSELEKDAVLSYKIGTLPPIDDLMDQCRRTFINFHNHIRRYDAERICRCGACETAVDLTLKFIIHYGVVETLQVKEHQKLHGFDVILAHRLLKNQIPENEYILFSDKIELGEAAVGNKNSAWYTIVPDSAVYDEIGRVNFNYVSFKPIHEYVKEPDPITIPGLGPEKVTLKTAINAPVDKIYENFTNFEKRLEWNEEIREIILKNEKINKAGALHTCLVGSNALEIEAVGRMENDDRIDSFKGLKDIVTIYTFEKGKNETFITVDLDYKTRSWIAKLFKSMIRRMLMLQTKKGLQKLKVISEAG